jgi:nitrogen fixation protein NifU and related proteins
MSIVSKRGSPETRHDCASLRTALSAQPPPTQPTTSLPSASIKALEPRRAEEDPSTRTTVAIANGRSLAARSAALLYTSDNISERLSYSFALITLQVGRDHLYSNQIREHYAHPRNVGRVEEPSAEAMVRSPLDSDTVLVSLRIEAGIITEAKFKCMGCAVAIACSSISTEMILGKTVEEAAAVSEQVVADALGGIPEYKMRCSNLAPAAIRTAVDKWKATRG